jgi:hypothetical protein
MDGIALIKRSVPDLLIHRYRLMDRIVKRSECHEDEIHFMHQTGMRLLPVWMNGELKIVEWGSRGRTKLPRSLFCSQVDLENSVWSPCQPESIEIPATYAIDHGVWYLVPDAAIQGILLYDENGLPHAYVITQQSTVYYKNMTRNPREPVFAGEQI